MDWKDQLTRRWWQEPATFNVMTHLSKNCHDSISAWGFPRCHPDDEAPRQGTCCWLLAYCAWWHTESDQSCSNTFSVTTYPSVLLCVAQETWLLHTNLGNENLAHRHWPSAIGWLSMWMMIAKAHMRGLWEACRCCCCILFTLYVSPSFHFRFTLFLFTQLGISRRSMCIGACYAGTASWCDLRDPGWGDPGFRHCDFFAWHLPVIFKMLGFELLLQGWPAQDGAHKLPGHYVSSLLLDMSFHFVMFWFLWCFCAFCFVSLWFCCLLVLVWLLCFSFLAVEWYHINLHHEPGSLLQHRLHLQ